MVTHRMLETLAMIARMPAGYRILRREKLKSTHEDELSGCVYALEAFQVLLKEKGEQEISKEGLACYKSVVGSAKAAVRSLAAR